MKRTFAYSLFGILLATHLPSAFAAEPAEGTHGEFGNNCAQGLATGHVVPTDCKVNWTDAATKKVYCFSSEASKTEFAKDVAGNEKKANDSYAKHLAKTATPPAAVTKHEEHVPADTSVKEEPKAQPKADALKEKDAAPEPVKK